MNHLDITTVENGKSGTVGLIHVERTLAKNALQVTVNSEYCIHDLSETYLSLHRSEGFGLTVHEALLHQETVIATGWSATANLRGRFSRLISATVSLAPYGDWLLHYPGPSFRWAEPDIRWCADQLWRLRGSRQINTPHVQELS